MDNMNLNKHISGQFNTELEAVRNNVLAMGDWWSNSWPMR